VDRIREVAREAYFRQFPDEVAVPELWTKYLLRVNVMVTVFGDFRQFSAKISSFFLKKEIDEITDKQEPTLGL
jgi:hypothetical protein